MLPSFSLFLQAICLGVLQGLTEFLPVSSTAHLILLPWFFRWDNPLMDSLTFDVALHAGTLAALVWYFREDWVRLSGGFLRTLIRQKAASLEERLAWFILLSTIPAAIAGYFLQSTAEKTFRHPILICATLAAVSAVMLYAERRSQKSKALDRFTLQDSLLVGIAQSLALLPGVSRSGITISAGLLRNYQREAATRFSFLLSTPIIAGAAGLHLGRLFSRGMLVEWPLFIAGFISAAIAGYLAIRFLMGYLRRHSLDAFAYYRLALAFLIMASYLHRG